MLLPRVCSILCCCQESDDSGGKDNGNGLRKRRGMSRVRVAVEKTRESKSESGSKRESRSRISERQLLHGGLADRRTEKHTGKRREMGAAIALPLKRPV